MELSLITVPAIVFSVVSLLLLAYSNRFHGICSLVRSIKDDEQISILVNRLGLIKYAIGFGQVSMLFATFSILLIFATEMYMGAWWFFLGSLLSLIIAISCGIADTMIGMNALEKEIGRKK